MGVRRRTRRRAVVGGAMLAEHHANKEADQQAQYQDQQQYAEPAPEEAAPAEPTMDEKIHEIDELSKLHDSGALTDEEFAAQKDQILNG